MYLSESLAFVFKSLSFEDLMFKDYVNVTFLKYATVGVFSNFLGFGLYLLLTLSPLDEKIVLTLLFLLGSCFSIFGNKSYTFSEKKYKKINTFSAFIVYFSAYILNIVAHLIFVDWLTFDHRMVQFVCVGVIAIYIYVILQWLATK